MQINDILKVLQKIDSSISIDDDSKYLIVEASLWGDVANELK